MQSLIRGDDPRQIKEIVNNIVKQFDNTGTVTLTASATTTVVKNTKVNVLSIVQLQATNAAAAGAIATTFVSAKGDGQFTITHASATTDRNFDYVIFGV